MIGYTLGRRWLWVVSLATLLVLAVVACGSDPTATSEPTATPTPPTATPLPPTATPAPPPPADTPEPEEAPSAMNPLEKLVLTPATTGRDLFGSLSEEETNCIKSNIGEAFFGLMMDAPIMQAAASPEAAAPVFGCINEENLVLIGVAFMEAQSPGWEEETRACITEVGKRHPNVTYVRLGLAYQGDSADDASETNLYNLEVYECMTNKEKQEFTLALWIGVDRNAQATGADVVGLLSEEELACVMEDLSVEEIAAVATATPLQAVTLANKVIHCIDPETNIEIFVKGLEWGLGDFSEESVECLKEFAIAQPEYMALVQSGIENMMAMDPDEFVAITDAGLGQYDCMTDEELETLQMAFTNAMSAQQ